MSWYEEIFLMIILGFVQGVTEFLPVSSTAHVFLMGSILSNTGDIGLGNSNIIQMGALFAAIYYFKQDLKKDFKQFSKILRFSEVRKNYFYDSLLWLGWSGSKKKSQDFQKNTLLNQIIIATLPILILSIIFYEYILEFSRNAFLIALALIVGGVLLYLAEKWNKYCLEKKFNLKNSPNTLSFKDSLIIGFFQALSAIPGMSRSGSALTGALMIGHNRSLAIKFSFLISIPILFLAGLKGLWDWYFDPEKALLSLQALLIGFITAYISAYYFLKWLIGYLNKYSSNIFVIYRIGLGVLILILI